MRHDKHLKADLGLTGSQTFFVTCWFNMVHQASLDSYRVRVMNPENVLREYLKMLAPPANDADRKRVAEEALEILTNEKILKNGDFPGIDETIDLLQQLHIKKSRSEKDSESENPAQGNKSLIVSYANQVLVSLNRHFLSRCFDWVESQLGQPDRQISNEEKLKEYSDLERVCRNLLSVAMNDGSSLETLFRHYKTIVAPPLDEAHPFNFIERLNMTRERLTAAPSDYNLVFILDDAPPKFQFPSRIGSVFFSTTPPTPYSNAAPHVTKFLKKPGGRRVYVSTTTQARDGRAAGMIAYRQIGEILDLIRFEYDKSSVNIRSEFLLDKGDRHILLQIPAVVPNPENELPPLKLEEFVEHLDALVTRNTMQPEAKDRIFAALRLYRVGADATIFENKLINWWTAVEYLVKGTRNGGAGIGDSVEVALASTLCMAYIPKHLNAYRSAFSNLNLSLTKQDGTSINLGELRYEELYKVLKDSSNLAQLEAMSSSNQYLWFHLRNFISGISSPKSVAEMISNHERRLRWQIQRIYRARCDIVHSGQQVANATLLCANLEFYLKVSLDAMLRSFHDIATLSGPQEFFERARHEFVRTKDQLVAPKPSDELLIRSINAFETRMMASATAPEIVSVVSPTLAEVVVAAEPNVG